MNSDQINTHRSNIIYELTALFSVLEKQKEERVFKYEGLVLSYTPEKGLLLKGRNPDISVTHKGVLLPEEYTSVSQVPYEWIKKLKTS